MEDDGPVTEAPQEQKIDRSGENSLQKSQKRGGKFINPWDTFRKGSVKGSCQFFCCMCCETRRRGPWPKKAELDANLPVVKPDFDSQLNSDNLSITWIGHSTTILRIDGVTVLTDPVWSKRCSPSQVIGPSRYRDVPCTIDDIPKIDAVIISHNHYDHLDIGSVKALNKRFGDQLAWFVPLGNGQWMKDRGCNVVTELDWWEEGTITSRPDVKFVCTPAQHFSNRGLFDNNKTLWASWCVVGPKHRFFFGGDTAYCPAFLDIADKFGPFDLGAIPIGAYEPNQFMRNVHVNPEEAVQIHQDTRCKVSMAIHWGTFDLAWEHYMNPVERLKAELKRKGISEDEFFPMTHGETKHFPN